MTTLSDTNVLVSWKRLASQDISGYRIYYFRTDINPVKRQALGPGEESVRVSGDANSAVVGGLQAGVEYRFQVVALVLISGLEREGVNRSEGVMALVAGVRGVIIANFLLVSLSPLLPPSPFPYPPLSRQ